MSTTYHGVRVSEPHGIILNAYEKKYGVRAQVSQGERTLAEQWFFYNEKGQYDAVTNPHGAAYPSQNAPHIKHGADNHALDINAGDHPGQAGHVAAFYRSLGAVVSFDVRTEPWHMDPLTVDSLHHAARQAQRLLDPVLRKGSTGPYVIKLKRLLANKGYGGFSANLKGEPGNNRFNPYYGRYTVDTVERFQKKNGIPVTGKVDAETWKKLRS